MNLVDALYWINGAFKGALSWTPTANRSISLPDDSGTVLLDDRPIGSAGAGVSVRGYLPIVTVSGSKTLALSDANTTQICTATATITIPANLTVAYPIGTEIAITRNTSGTVTLALSAGVTATDRNGNTNTLTQVTNYTRLKKVGTDAWLAINPVPNSFNLPGNPTCNTQTPGTNSTAIATTAFVQNAATIAGSVVNPTNTTILEWTIPAGVRRLTLVSVGIFIDPGSLVRFGTSAGLLTTGYYSISSFIGASTGLGSSTGLGMQVPESDATSGFCMNFHRISPNTWNFTGLSRIFSSYMCLTAGSVELPGELTTLRYTNQGTMNSGSLQLLWEY